MTSRVFASLYHGLAEVCHGRVAETKLREHEARRRERVAGGARERYLHKATREMRFLS